MTNMTELEEQEKELDLIKKEMDKTLATVNFYEQEITKLHDYLVKLEEDQEKILKANKELQEKQAKADEENQRQGEQVIKVSEKIEDVKALMVQVTNRSADFTAKLKTLGQGRWN